VLIELNRVRAHPQAYARELRRAEVVRASYGAGGETAQDDSGAADEESTAQEDPDAVDQKSLSDPQPDTVYQAS
jgi:hypothetical protein